MEQAINIFDGLNPEQAEAVRSIYGPVLVNAGPGAGKTATLTKRAQYMIMQGIDPASILLTTFTNKAATEIKERIVKVVGEEGKQITVGTFHSVCNRILRIYGHKLGYTKTFTILSEDDTDKVIKKAAKQYGLDNSDLKAYISDCKSRLITPAKALANAKSNELSLANAYDVYQKTIFDNQSMDFDDLLLNTVILLENYADVKKALNNKWKYISGDEVQDSSDTDARLMELLAGEEQNVFLVGDDLQGIYNFRGANIDVILNLESRYPGLKFINLKNNYRSTDTIVYGAKSLVDKNKKQLKKELHAAREIKGAPIIQTKCKNQEHEARNIVTYIKMCHNKYKIPYNEIAVLYRMTYLSRNIEEALMKEKISYTLIGSIPFFCREEVQDILAYIRVILNEKDMLAFTRSINKPKRGIGDASLRAIEEFVRTHAIDEMTPRAALVHPDLQKKLRGKAKQGVKDYAEFLDKLEQKASELSPNKLINWLIVELDYVGYLQETKDEKDLQPKIENLQELVNVASEYNDLEDLLVQASLYREDTEDNSDKVQLMTMHKSKGLEYKAVIVAGCAEGISPHYKACEDPLQMEEERRCMYVAMTRAKDYLFMTYPSMIKIQGKDNYAKPSRFLNEINPKYVYKN